MSGQLTLQGTTEAAFSEAKRKKVLRALAVSTGVALGAVHIASVVELEAEGGEEGGEDVAPATAGVKICFEIEAENEEAEAELEASLKGSEFPTKFSASLKQGGAAGKKGKKKGKKGKKGQ